MMKSRILPFAPEHPLRVHWMLTTCGIAVAIGAFCGLLNGLSFTSPGAGVDGSVSSQILDDLDRPTGLVTPREVIVCSVLAGAITGLALVSMPLMTIMILRFRSALYAARRCTKERLNQEMAATIDRARRGPANPG